MEIKKIMIKILLVRLQQFNNAGSVYNLINWINSQITGLLLSDRRCGLPSGITGHPSKYSARRVAVAFL